MKVNVGDIVQLSRGFSEAEIRSAPGTAGLTVVGQMTTGSLAVVLEVLGSSALEVRVLLGNTVGWVCGSFLRPANEESCSKQEKKND